MTTDDDLLIVSGPDGGRWYVVAEAAGNMNAEIVAGLLRAANIPTYLYREAAGSSALPVTIGMLGLVKIAVPEIYYEEALALLEADDGDDDEADDFDDADFDDYEAD